MKLWKAFYNTAVVPLLWISFRVGALFNDKIRRGVRGRRGLFERLARDVAALKGTRRLWFHASSLGEFEQAKPIIAALKSSDPGIDIIATFFSPSGYEHSRNYRLANVIAYLPFDSRGSVRRFIDILRPTAAIMVRYDIWPNLIWELERRRIPVYIANATLSNRSPRFLPVVRQFHRTVYNAIGHILTVSESDRSAFQRMGITTPELAVVGDTRFDQVVMRNTDARKRRVLPDAVVAGKTVFIVGQSWEEDDEVVLPVALRLLDNVPDLLTILVPHEPTVENLEQIESKLEGFVPWIRLSDIQAYRGERVILVDSVGVLVPLYQYAHVAYIGGSFRQGIHNVLEPAVFGIPVVYGPRHTNSQEAVELAARGGGFVIEDERQLYRVLRTLLENSDERRDAGARARTLVEEHRGATERFLRYLLPLPGHS